MDEEDIYGGLPVVPAPTADAAPKATVSSSSEKKVKKSPPPAKSVVEAASSSAKPASDAAKTGDNTPTTENSATTDAKNSGTSGASKPVIRLTMPKPAANAAWGAIWHASWTI